MSREAKTKVGVEKRCVMCRKEIRDGIGFVLELAGLEGEVICFLCYPQFRDFLWKEMMIML